MPNPPDPPRELSLAAAWDLVLAEVPDPELRALVQGVVRTCEVVGDTGYAGTGSGVKVQTSTEGRTPPAVSIDHRMLVRRLQHVVALPLERQDADSAEGRRLRRYSALVPEIAVTTAIYCRRRGTMTVSSAKRAILIAVLASGAKCSRTTVDRWLRDGSTPDAEPSRRRLYLALHGHEEDERREGAA